MHVVLNVLDARGPGEQRGKGRGGGGRGQGGGGGKRGLGYPLCTVALGGRGWGAVGSSIWRPRIITDKFPRVRELVRFLHKRSLEIHNSLLCRYLTEDAADRGAHADSGEPHHG